MPLIKYLLERGADVVIASDGRAADLLRAEFPQLVHLPLPPYNVTYRTDNMFVNLAPQAPYIFWAIAKEHQTTRQIVQQHGIDAIISDNRFGVHYKGIPNYFISHQIDIQIPFSKPLQHFINWLNRRYIQRFEACWVPDVSGEPNLSGVLGHPADTVALRYIGVLSRLHYAPTPKRYHALILLSGAEPQRTYLEERIRKQIAALPDKQFVLVRGVTNHPPTWHTSGNLTEISYLTTDTLNQYLLASEVIITRSGYSTIMDLSVTGNRAILIPTPGQTEQEYLAEELHRKGIFLHQKQNAVNIADGLREVASFSGFAPDMFAPQFHPAIDDLLHSLRHSSTT